MNGDRKEAAKAVWVGHDGGFLKPEVRVKVKQHQVAI